MSTPLEPRRSERNRAQPQQFAEEQASMQEVAAQLAALRRLSQQRQREAALADSEVEGTSVEECSAMEEEGGAQGCQGTAKSKPPKPP
jgi:hypothetical protein